LGGTREGNFFKFGREFGLGLWKEQGFPFFNFERPFWGKISLWGDWGVKFGGLSTQNLFLKGF